MKTHIHKPFRVLIGKAGLDGHDRGAKFITRVLRDHGFEVIYTGIRRTPEEIANSAVQEDVAAVGLSSLSGGHMQLFPHVLAELKQRGGADIAVLAGGIIPDEDAKRLKKMGIKGIFTPGTSAEEIVKAFTKVCRAGKRAAR
jgi:methylmalonyl-CoA mutase C-terminal domain/subunit